MELFKDNPILSDKAHAISIQVQKTPVKGSPLVKPPVKGPQITGPEKVSLSDSLSPVNHTRQY